jgi:hypothetical protein
LLTSTAITKVANFIIGKMDHAVIKINNVDTTVAIQSTKVSNNVLYIYVWLDDTVTGTITNTKLIDKDGDVFVEKADNITKDVIIGTLITFKMTLTEVV